MVKESIVARRAYAFALQTIRLRSAVRREHDVLSRQMLRPGTSIGANVEEALAGYSRRDFAAKMAIAYKEARECRYWLRLLRDSGAVSGEAAEPLIRECGELVRMLTSIVKTTRESE